MGNRQLVNFSSYRNVAPSRESSNERVGGRNSIEAKRSAIKSSLSIQDKLALANRRILLKKNMKWKMVRDLKRAPFNNSSKESSLENLEVNDVKRIKA